MDAAHLTAELAKLATFDDPDERAEQYATDPALAAELLLKARADGNLHDVLDLGAGTGILSIGAALLGARVTAVEQDGRALRILAANAAAAGVGIAVVHGRVEEYAEEHATVVMNPPFGTRSAHADRVFLSQAALLARDIYTIHKATSSGFLDAFTRDHGLSVAWRAERDHRLPRTLAHHTRRSHAVRVVLAHVKKL